MKDFALVVSFPFDGVADPTPAGPGGGARTDGASQTYAGSISGKQISKLTHPWLGEIGDLDPGKAGAKSIEILAARKPVGVNPDALVFSTDTGTPFDRHNLANRQLNPICKKLGLTGVSWTGCGTRTQLCSMLWALR